MKERTCLAEGGVVQGRHQRAQGWLGQRISGAGHRRAGRRVGQRTSVSQAKDFCHEAQGSARRGECTDVSKALTVTD